uniref:Uncharacterized protein n=1 Tax=Anguilla anguilla TaxID=7936 RepID=A0A0E9RNR3_ANGAN
MYKIQFLILPLSYQSRHLLQSITVPCMGTN